LVPARTGEARQGKADLEGCDMVGWPRKAGVWQDMADKVG